MGAGRRARAGVGEGEVEVAVGKQRARICLSRRQRRWKRDERGPWRCRKKRREERTQKKPRGDVRNLLQRSA